MCGESKKLMNERISGWMIGEWMNERMNEWTDKMSEEMKKWINSEWMNINEH